MFGKHIRILDTETDVQTTRISVYYKCYLIDFLAWQLESNQMRYDRAIG